MLIVLEILCWARWSRHPGGNRDNEQSLGPSRSIKSPKFENRSRASDSQFDQRSADDGGDRMPPASNHDVMPLECFTWDPVDGESRLCIAGNKAEVIISATGTQTGEPSAQYTDCHAHDEERSVSAPRMLSSSVSSTLKTEWSRRYCVSPEGEDVLVVEAVAQESEPHQAHEENESHNENPATGGESCRFLAGIEYASILMTRGRFLRL